MNWSDTDRSGQERTGDEHAVEMPDYIPLDVLEDWREYRKKDTSRKKWTERMERGFLRECKALHEAGYDVVRCIDKAMQAGWLMPYGREDCKRKHRPRDTVVTDLRLVERSDAETARAHIEEMKRRAR